MGQTGGAGMKVYVLEATEKWDETSRYVYGAYASRILAEEAADEAAHDGYTDVEIDEWQVQE